MHQQRLPPPPPTQSKKRARLSTKQRRIRQLEKDAARRTFNGNGMNDSLPPLPVTQDSNEGNDHAEENDDAGFDTLFGHPYGALPYGNIHFASRPSSSDVSVAADGQPSSLSSLWHPDKVRHDGLGPNLRQLNDEQLITILSFVDGPTLASGICCASKFLYVAGHHEELWRDLVLRRWGEVGFTVRDPHDTEEDDSGSAQGMGATGCWKDIYAWNHHPSDSTKAIIQRHSPISIQGIYSDTFFRSWLCRSFALQPSWLSTHTVSSIPHSEMTTERFYKEYEETNTPVLIKGASKTWPAVQQWTRDYLLSVASEKRFRATSGAAPLPAQFTLADYLNYCDSSTEEAPLYLFDRTFATKCPQLLHDFDKSLKSTCGWWDGETAEFGHDLFGVLGEGRRPDYQWLIVGPKRSGSCFHIDPNCTHAWNAPIIGRKRWIFYPPGVTPPGVFPSPNGDDVCMPISIGEWFLTFWDQHVERRKDPDVRRRPLECTACPGDVLFVPHGWWHMVMNIGDDDIVGGVAGGDERGVSVALTRNYVSGSNLSDVLRFLDSRVNQISGCRDRGEAIQPDDLGREFRKALSEVKRCTSESLGEEKKDDNGEEDKGRWTDLLERAERKAKEGWGCDAWVDLPSTCPGSGNADKGNCGDPSEEKDEPKDGTKSSILARAKQSSSSTNGCGASAIPASSGSFSFSFL
mmetsp:Transcript_2545/g.5610  ORF Transcript_2545/g.5610 Transcript_2545/m.5610 type:complete len:690 (+) Transcript_2545:65-2134(+)